MFFRLVTSVGQRKKFCGVSMRNRTSDPRIPSSDALPLSHRDSGEQVSLLLGSAMSIASCFVQRTRKMVSFKLGKEIEKDAFRLVTSVEQRKISSSIIFAELKTYHLSCFVYKI